MVTASGGLGSGTYTYDGNGLRVEKVAGSTTTVYIFSGAKVIAEYANGAAPSSPTREYIYAGGALLARIDSSGTNYYHQDHLSNRMVTNSSGGVVAEMGHFPFGESWYNATNDKLYFTTYEYDSESGNHYAMARYHVSRLGRLSSPDPIAGSIANPQSLNRYSYSINDPANVTDPSGALPLSSCTTAQAKPKDQSQQASGGGHSDPDDSDADTDGSDADADQPPQNGCVSHVNPYGGGGANIDGGFGGDDSGDLPSGGFGPGQSTPGGTDLASEIALESVPAWFGWLPGNGENGDAPWMWYKGTIFWTFIDPATTGARTAAAVQRALEALTNPKCASLFAFNPVELLTRLASGTSSLGAITNANLGVTPTPTGFQVDVAVTTGILGSGPTNFSGANITINNNPTSPFNAGWGGATAFGAPLSAAYSDAELNAATIIHELGHAANDIFGPGSSAILWDQGNRVFSQLNTNFVLKHCF